MPVARVSGAEDDGGLAAQLGGVAQVAGEAREAAAVASDFLAVHPHGRLIVNRLEMQQDFTVVPFGGDGDFAPVPHRFHEIDVLDARQLGFGAERNDDAVLQAFLAETALLACIRIVYLKLPFAIQVHPFLADKLGARVLWTWNSCH